MMDFGKKCAATALLKIVVVFGCVCFCSHNSIGAAIKRGDGMTASSTVVNKKVVLQHVPRFGCYNGESGWCVEENAFPSCLRVFLQFKGVEDEINSFVGTSDRWHKAYMNLMGASGSSFRLLWTPEWQFGSTDLMAMSPDALEPIKRAIGCLGYAYDIRMKKKFAATYGILQTSEPNEATFVAMICDSLRKGNPVIAHGVVSPEFCLITGYDPECNALLGWSNDQDDPNFNAGKDPSGYFIKTDWYSSTQMVITLGDKLKAPPLKEAYLESLRMAVKVMRTGKVRDMLSGPSAYNAWADSLRNDGDFPKDNQQVMRQRYAIHKLSGLTVAEGRAWGAQYLNNVAIAYPIAKKELTAASDCLNAEHDLVWAIWEFTGGDTWSDDAAMKLANSGVRSRIIPLIRLMGKLDSEAADHIERALKIIGKHHD